MENYENDNLTKLVKKPVNQKSLPNEEDIIPSLASMDLGKQPNMIDHKSSARNLLKRGKSFKRVPSVSYDSCQNILPERQSSEENQPGAHLFRLKLV
jgi:hypothetical protein